MGSNEHEQEIEIHENCLTIFFQQNSHVNCLFIMWNKYLCRIRTVLLKSETLCDDHIHVPVYNLNVFSPISIKQ